MSRHGKASRGPSATAAAIVVGLVAGSAVIWRSTNAAFVDSTANANNSWSTGSVVLSDTVFAASLPFAPVSLKPGSSGSGCTEVTYTGSLDAAVRLHAANFGNPGGHLGEAVELFVETQPGAVCSGFDRGEGTVIFGDYDHVLADDDSLADFGAKTTFAGGLPAAGPWSPTGGAPADVMSYLITYYVLDDNAAQNETATVDFVWEAQNT